MSHLQVIEGTTEEVTAMLNKAYAGRKVRAWIEPEEDSPEELPEPPNTIRDSAHLERLLLDGQASPTHKVTEETWDTIRREVRQRHAARTTQ